MRPRPYLLLRWRMRAPRYVLLDVDNTLYPKSSGLDKVLRRRIIEYLMDRHGLTAEEAEGARARYIKEYGLSLPGIMNDFDTDVVDYMRFIHDVDIEEYIKPNPELCDMLDAIDAEKVLYTNSSEQHTRRVISALGLNISAFGHIVDFRSTGYIAKPFPESFEAMLGIIGAKGEECVMVDDMPKTIIVAKQAFGMGTVLVDEDDVACCTEADRKIKRIGELKQAIYPV